MNDRIWTPIEIDLVREIYPDVPAADVAALLQRALGSVYQLANRMGFAKSQSFWESDVSGRIARGKQLPSMIATQFKPGHDSWNKGRKGINYPGMRATQFKPGSKPHTTVPVGSYRITTKDRYLERKMNELPGNNSVRWTPVHRLVWEAAHGPIPPGHMVSFKPGCKTTDIERITADRLECISRADNARRNHPNSKHPELGRLIQLKGVITRHINRIAREAQEAARP